MTLNRNDLVVGLIVTAIGLGFGLNTLLALPIGTALRMGPGYFPLALSLILLVAGIGILVKAVGHVAPPPAPMPWRGLAVVLPVPIIFGLTIRGLGLVPTVALVVFVAAFASRRATVPLALGLAIGLTVFCTLVFHYGLGLPLRLFGPWIEAFTGPLE